MTISPATWLRSVGLAACLAFGVGTAAAEPINKDAEDVAIRGYDTVAYFTEGKPVEGKASYAHEWQDARWLFANEEHRELFASDPERYAPRYGGHCAGGMSLGMLLPIDPEAWAIVDGRLYLNYHKEGRDEFVVDPEPIIEKADANWERLGAQ